MSMEPRKRFHMMKKKPFYFLSWSLLFNKNDLCENILVDNCHLFSSVCECSVFKVTFYTVLFVLFTYRFVTFFIFYLP